MSNDGFAELAARSAKVKNENLQLLQGLKVFEQKILDLVGGLRVSGNSETVAFDEILDLEGEPIGHTACYLAFNSKELMIGWRDVPRPSDDDYWRLCSLEKAGTDMQRRLSDQNVLNSLVADIGKNLEREFEKTTSVVQSLSQFLTIEKAEIDSDFDGLFSSNSMLLDSWLKARNTVLTDPEQSITLSCSHIETVLKGCLKTLGATEYETLPIEKLIRKTLGILKAENTLDSVTAEMIQGAITISKSIGETRNFKSSSHGKNEGYIPPSTDLAQLANHLAGVVSVYVMKQTAIVQAR
ncbi:abortive infection family protein [Pseudomonas sp. REP124]|uniref:abortive infection family protein n=1 Tax=Pseudomonas sp. REP124 TaxID=2875731 RepID=UPI001CCEAA22|nr:abortive infection family protein [Pseudomonas sp. REP124]MBZ9782845.1 abortive infection family protein [Pseudomonas sp. REP124]